MNDGVDRLVMVGAAVMGSWPAFVVLFLLCILVFGYLVPKAKAPIFAQAGAEPARKVLDEYFPTWTPAVADRFFEAVGPAGRVGYRRFYLIMDFWFPGTIASLATASLMLIAFPPASGWGWLCVIAAPAWLFDVAENVTHFRMAGSYPKVSAVLLRAGPWFTFAKWVFAILPLPVALIGLGFRYLRGW